MNNNEVTMEEHKWCTLIRETRDFGYHLAMEGPEFKAKDAEIERLKADLAVVVDALKEIADVDYRGNKPPSARYALEALAKIGKDKNEN